MLSVSNRVDLCCVCAVLICLWSYEKGELSLAGWKHDEVAFLKISLEVKCLFSMQVLVN